MINCILHNQTNTKQQVTEQVRHQPECGQMTITEAVYPTLRQCPQQFRRWCVYLIKHFYIPACQIRNSFLQDYLF